MTTRRRVVAGRGPRTAFTCRSRQLHRSDTGHTRIAIVVLAALIGAVVGSVTYAIHPGISDRAHSSTTTTTSTATSTTLPPVAGSVDLADLVARVQPSVVSIETSVVRGNLTGRGAGTGVILTSDGEVLTNAHVVANAVAIRVSIAGIAGTRPATLVGADPSSDIAFLRISGASGLLAATIGSSTALRIGSDVVAIGNALDLQGGPTVTRGIISALGRTVNTQGGALTGMIQTDAAISSGNSGGPLIDTQGHVIGINTAAASSNGSISVESISFAIPIDQAMAVIARLRGQANGQTS